MFVSHSFFRFKAGGNLPSFKEATNQWGVVSLRLTVQGLYGRFSESNFFLFLEIFCRFLRKKNSDVFLRQIIFQVKIWWVEKNLKNKLVR